MEVVVRYFLSAIDTVILKRKDSQGLIGLDQRECDPFGRSNNRGALVIREIEYCSDMSAGYYATLSNLKLPWINHRKCVVTLINDSPLLVATCHSFANFARALYGKFNHMLKSAHYFLAASLAISNVRFGSLAVPLVNTSPMSASEDKADVQTAAFLITDSLLTANCGPNPTGLNCASGAYYIQGNQCQALK